MPKYGYLRVSSKDQNLARQLQMMHDNDVPSNNIFFDKQSGATFNRENYKKMLKKLKEGDILIICSIDRLGRNYTEILENWRYLTHNKGIDIEVLDMPLLNTNQQKEGLTGVFISDLVLQILAYVAEKERDNIKARQAQGIAIAKANGVKFGRKPSILPTNFDIYYRAWETKQVDIHTIAKQLNITEQKFYTYVRRYRQIELSTVIN